MFANTASRSIRTGIRLAAAGLAAAGIGIATAGAAAAQPIPVTPTVTVTIAPGASTVTAQVVSTATIPGTYIHQVTVTGPALWASASSTTPLVAVTVPVASLTPGTNRVTLIDSDGTTAPLAVVALRQSRIRSWYVAPIGARQAAVYATVQMWDPYRGWVGQKSSPVQVQARMGCCEWRTVGTVTTDATGQGRAVGVVNVPKTGMVRVRLVRAQGSTVSQAVTGYTTTWVF